MDRRSVIADVLDSVMSQMLGQDYFWISSQIMNFRNYSKFQA